MGRSLGYAAAGFGTFLLLGVLSFLFTGGGHGTALFALIVLSPGSLAGDNPAALTGVLFWPTVGFLLGLAPKRSARALVVLLMLAHYAVAGILLGQEGVDGAEGFRRVWDALPVQLGLFCLVYAGANLTVWVLVARKQPSPT
jgi:hypothetical protein